MDNKQVQVNADFLKGKYDKNESNICSREIMDPKIIRSRIGVTEKITTLHYTKTRKAKGRFYSNKRNKDNL